MLGRPKSYPCSGCGCDLLALGQRGGRCKTFCGSCAQKRIRERIKLNWQKKKADPIKYNRVTKQARRSYLRHRAIPNLTKKLLSHHKELEILDMELNKPIILMERVESVL